MKKLRLLFFIVILIGGRAILVGQDFVPSGTPSIRVFTNFHSQLSDGEVLNAFQIQRAYLGYKHQFSRTISGKLYLDVADPGVGKLQMTGYLKNAYLQYKGDRLTAKFGLIGLHQFRLQEDLWGGRYLFKSFQDQYKFGPSADLGAHISYKLSSMMSADITVANGEGYKSIQQDSLLKYSAGFTVRPYEGVDLRVYYDYMGIDQAQQSLSLYAGYTLGRVKIGAEYNKQFNHKMNGDEHLYGLSFYSSYTMEKTRIFCRFDQLSSVEIIAGDDPWNLGKDGRAILAGIEYSPVKGILVTPNYQAWIPADGSSVVHIAYLSCQIKF
ncbi:MAG: hypothetical protein HN352_14310 [Bacteroidetes bacterium]|nr:hypothetical protein [Bacteroidota bacterium]MBT4397892.1 hypothetical protein [Bacteroidota bacterium]MBT4411554.1 hypothetical protein [Bacteroidota bacterium]MBT7093972.1 hypothetical protein [Bacteroidota bacterium]MBT7465174.1 hypothetical protein [Bacteroidota bacterium]